MQGSAQGQKLILQITSEDVRMSFTGQAQFAEKVRIIGKYETESANTGKFGKAGDITFQQV